MSTPRPRALVVDDSKVTCRILESYLERLGYETAAAHDGEEALSRLLAAPGEFSLALVDWDMPKMDGLALIERLRSDGRFNALQILMVTTESQLSAISRALEAGATEYVMKPFTEEVLRDKLAIMSSGLLAP